MCSVWLPESFEYFTAQVTHFICIWHLFLLYRWSLCAARSFQYVSVHAKMPVSTQFLLLCNVDDAQIKILESRDANRLLSWCRTSNRFRKNATLYPLSSGTFRTLAVMTFQNSELGRHHHDPP